MGTDLTLSMSHGTAPLASILAAPCNSRTHVPSTTSTSGHENMVSNVVPSSSSSLGTVSSSSVPAPNPISLTLPVTQPEQKVNVDEEEEDEDPVTSSRIPPSHESDSQPQHVRTNPRPVPHVMQQAPVEEAEEEEVEETSQDVNEFQQSQEQDGGASGDLMAQEAANRIAEEAEEQDELNDQFMQASS